MAADATWRSWLPRASRVATLLLPALILLYAGMARRWVGDDGFINVRVAQQLLLGHGFVFNLGERVEAITSPAWVLVLAAAGRLGWRLDDAAWLLSLACSVLGLLLAGLARPGSVTAGSERELRLPLGLLCYACLPPAWDYATSGLENGLGLAFLGASYWAVARCLGEGEPPPARLLGAAAWLGIAPLVRPDYLLACLPLIGLCCWRARGRARPGVLAAALCAGGAYQIFRMGYFASLVPNTALAKEAFVPRWDQGWLYFWNSAGTYWLALPLACVLASVLGESRGRAARSLGPWLLACGALHLVYVVRVGGDFMHGRLLLPGLFALFAAVPSVRLAPAPARRALLPSGLACAAAWAWCVLCAVSLRVPDTNQDGIGDERGWFAKLAERAHPTRLEHYERMPFYRAALDVQQQLAQSCGASGRCRDVLVTRAADGELDDHDGSPLLELQPHAVPDSVEAVVAFRPLGIAGTLLGPSVDLVDYYGLADPIGSRLELHARGRPGHEKSFGTVWLAAKYASARSSSDSEVRAARQALDCGPLRELREATTQPLDLSRFMRNARLALTTYRLRIPGSPQAARKRFCQDRRKRSASVE